MNPAICSETILYGHLGGRVAEITKEGRECLVVEDGAYCHQSYAPREVKDLVGITLIHPPNSPDLNPEKMW